jgi:hypothetical protein
MEMTRLIAWLCRRQGHLTAPQEFTSYRATELLVFTVDQCACGKISEAGLKSVPLQTGVAATQAAGYVN